MWQRYTAGEVVMAPLDGAMIHDITGPLAIQKFYEMGGVNVFDPERVIMLFDHQIPADSIEAANNHVYMRKFAAEQDIHNYDINEGVCHQVLSRKAGPHRERSLSERTPIPACTGRPEPLPLVSALPTWDLLSNSEPSTSRSRRPSGLRYAAGSRNVLVQRPDPLHRCRYRSRRGNL